MSSSLRLNLYPLPLPAEPYLNESIPIGPEPKPCYRYPKENCT